MSHILIYYCHGFKDTCYTKKDRIIIKYGLNRTNHTTQHTLYYMLNVRKIEFNIFTKLRNESYQNSSNYNE